MTRHLDRFLTCVVILCLASGAGHWLAMADTGHEGATRIERGSYNDIRKVSVSSTSGTELFPATVKRPDSLCRNNSGFSIYLGTTPGSQHGTTHMNIVNGFPVLSSETFRLDGSHTGVIYATAQEGQSSLDVRCLDGLVR